MSTVQGETHDASPPLIRACIVYMVLQTIFYMLFCLGRHVKGTTNSIDFYFLMPVAYVFGIAHCINGILLVTLGGAGKPKAEFLLQDPARIVAFMKIDKSLEFSHHVVNTFPKLAILALYTRIFTERPYRMASYAIAVLVVLTFVAGVVTSAAICQPFAYHWDKSIPGGKCGNVMATYWYFCIPNVIEDFLILVLPMPAIWKLHVELPTKIGIFLTFFTGSVGIVTGIVRSALVFKYDFFVDMTPVCDVIVWCVVEPGTYFLAACMPAMRPLKSKVFGEKSIVAWLFAGAGSNPAKVSWRTTKAKKIDEWSFNTTSTDAHSRHDGDQEASISSPDVHSHSEKP